MSAATQQRRITAMGDTLREMPGLSKVLRGLVYHRGCVLVGHGDRQMPYPTRGFNSAALLADGGPLQIAGADINGGLRAIAKQPNVRVSIVDGASLAIVVGYPGPNILIAVTCPVASTTAAALASALNGSAEVAALASFAFTGTGAGFVLAFSWSEIPWVRVLGLASGPFDSSAWPPGTDEPCDPNAVGVTVYVGELGLEMDESSPPAAGQVCYLNDNQTVSANFSALALPLCCVEVREGQAMCRLPHQALA